MKTKQVLELVCTFLGKEDLLSCPYFSASEQELSSDEQKELDILLRCLNLVTSEISTEYLPIYRTKKITLNGGEFDLKDIDENIFQIIKLEDEYSGAIKFRIFGDKLRANATNCTVTYTSFAPKTTLDGDIETFSSVMPDRVLAYGTAMEYCFISSLYDDATLWESRYKNSLLTLSQKKHNVVMPKRRWL